MTQNKEKTQEEDKISNLKGKKKREFSKKLKKEMNEIVIIDELTFG